MDKATRWGLATLIALTLAASRPAAAGAMTYLSLGDSLAFGETDFTHNPSNGDRGYVAHYANYLGNVNGGTRPNVVNLAVDGETTSSYSSGVGRVPPAPNPAFTDPYLASLNTNYSASPLVSQQQMFHQAVASEQAKGDTISTVSLSLGGNDLLALGLQPGFAALPPAQQAAQLTQTLGTIQSNLTNLLSDVRSHLPQANLLLVGDYNPFPAAPNSPFAPLAGPAIQGLNKLLQAEATAFNGHYIDTASAIAGNEAAYTHITDPPAGSNNIHPNDIGYAVIAGQLSTVSAAVPEPGSLAIMGTSFLALLGYGWHRRRSGE